MTAIHEEGMAAQADAMSRPVGLAPVAVHLDVIIVPILMTAAPTPVPTEATVWMASISSLVPVPVGGQASHVARTSTIVTVVLATTEAHATMDRTPTHVSVDRVTPVIDARRILMTAVPTPVPMVQHAQTALTRSAAHAQQGGPVQLARPILMTVPLILVIMAELVTTA
jgi:hypothetical protein